MLNQTAEHKASAVAQNVSEEKAGLEESAREAIEESVTDIGVSGLSVEEQEVLNAIVEHDHAVETKKEYDQHIQVIPDGCVQVGAMGDQFVGAEKAKVLDSDVKNTERDKNDQPV